MQIVYVRPRLLRPPAVHAHCPTVQHSSVPKPLPRRIRIRGVARLGPLQRFGIESLVEQYHGLVELFRRIFMGV